MTKPWAVLTSDVHYSLPTLFLAEASIRQAIQKANELSVPLIVAGDLHDTKGAMRGECVTSMLKSFQESKTPTYLIPGNHDRINEKSKPHALEFLRHLVSIVDAPTYVHGLCLVPYESDSKTLCAFLSEVTPGSTLIMHTGVMSAAMGHYTRDTSSLSPEAFASFRVITGHYHMRQTIGTVSYIGNPYTLNFGEALDPPKGFQVLNTDGSLTFVPTNLRKHIALERDYLNAMCPVPEFSPGDLVRMRVTGPKSELEKLNKIDIGNALFGSASFKLDLIPTKDAPASEKAAPALSSAEQLDALIDASSETPERKIMLKYLWRSLA